MSARSRPKPRNLLGRLAAWLGRRPQPAPLDAGQPSFESEPDKAALAGIVQSAYASGMAAERIRIEAILQAPGAATFPDIAIDLVLRPATGAQAAKVLARAESDAAARAAAIKSNLLESANIATLH